jgi:bacterioferritin
MTSQELLDALNSALAMDLRALTQYMWQHVMAKGMESPEIKEIFKEISIEEMKHAESIADRIFYLGGTPTTKP